MAKILVIRGGAIGDFVLTLPAISLLREGFPDARLEVLGYRHIVALAEGRRLVDAARSIEYGPLAGFFSRDNELDAELCEYFGGFQQIISYLYDPDRLFELNLRRCGVRHLITGSPVISDGDHAARQLARPMESLALYLEDHAAHVFPTEADLCAARALLARHNVDAENAILIHPGSGSPRKNWPVERWVELLEQLREDRWQFLILGGEADESIIARLNSTWNGKSFPVISGEPLTSIAALAAVCGRFAGHDSGISHIAAAAGARCVLLFGPTDPDVWAPANAGVRVLRGDDGTLDSIEAHAVAEAIAAMRTGY